MKTVRVRIAVAIDKNGIWNCAGWKQTDKIISDDYISAAAIDGIDSAEVIVHFVEADIPIPESETIEGEIK